MSEAAIFLANPTARSGRGTELQQAVLDELRSRNISLTVAPTHSAAELREAARTAGQGVRVIVMGGDGTVHHAVNGLSNSPASSAGILGIIAGGTGNDFARCMSLPVLSPKMMPGKKRANKASKAISDAVDAALAEPVNVDVIAITALGSSRAAASDGSSELDSTVQYCHSIATCGFAVDANNRADKMRWPRGPSKYTIASVLEALRLKPRRYLITIDDEEHEIESVLLAIANTGSFGGGYFIAPQACSTDGLIDLVIVGRVSGFTLTRLMPATRTGKHIRHPALKRLQGKVIEIRQLSENNADLRAEGELLGELPYRFEIMPGALRVAGAVPITKVPTTSAEQEAKDHGASGTL